MGRLRRPFKSVQKTVEKSLKTFKRPLEGFSRPFTSLWKAFPGVCVFNENDMFQESFHVFRFRNENVFQGIMGIRGIVRQFLVGFQKEMLPKGNSLPEPHQLRGWERLQTAVNANNCAPEDQ